MSNWTKSHEIDLRIEDVKKIKVGIVTARFNDHITGVLQAGAQTVLQSLKLSDKQIHVVQVPGAYEIPLGAKWLLDAGCDGVIALGCVIKGETPHFDYVCSAVERGCTTLQLESGKPVVFGVLTTNTEEQARDRIGGRHGHKGQEAAEVLVEMLNLKKTIFKKQTPKKRRKT